MLDKLVKGNPAPFGSEGGGAGGIGGTHFSDSGFGCDGKSGTGGSGSYERGGNGGGGSVVTSLMEQVVEFHWLLYSDRWFLRSRRWWWCRY